MTNMMKKRLKDWTTLQDGGSGTWLWVRESGEKFIFVEIIDMVDACGRDATMELCASVDIVAPSDLSPTTIQSAIQSCGWMGADVDNPLHLAEILHSYGAKAPMWSEDGGKSAEESDGLSVDEDSEEFEALLFAALEEAETYLDDAFTEQALDSRVVNNLGQTARQFMDGHEGLYETLIDIKRKGDKATPDQQLALKMYQNAGATLAGPIPIDVLAAITEPK